MSDASRGDTRPQTTTSFNDHPTPEQIAAWIDEPEFIPPEERRELDTHIADCRACQQVAEELRAIVAALSSLAEIEPPRSFVLTDETPQSAPQPIVMTETRAWRERQLRATRWATAIAAILLVLVLSVDLISGSGGSQSVTDATTMQMKSAPMSAAGAQSDDSTTSGASGGSVAQEQEQERTTGGEAADSSGDASTPENGAETFGFGTAATPASDSAAGSAPASEEGAIVATPDANMLTTAQETTSPDTAQSTANDDNRLRLVETGLAMLIVWLLIAMIAIPHLRRQSGNSR